MLLAALCRFLGRVSVLLALVGLAACSSTNQFSPGQHPSASAAVQGTVNGGQQPVAGAGIQLYTVGTAGDGSPATPLLNAATVTDVNGNFRITGDYVCTSATYVYLTATGGQPIPGTSNPALALMTALGPCTNFLPTTFTTVNEVTTVAAVAALAPFMSSAAALGSSSADLTSLQAAFNTAYTFADPSTGFSPGAGTLAGFTDLDFQTNFGNAAQTLPVVSTEGAAVANAAQSGSTYFCDSNTPSQSLLLFKYLQNHGIGMEGYTWDFTGQVFGSMVFYTSPSAPTYQTSSFNNLNCGDNGSGAVPATPQ